MEYYNQQWTVEATYSVHEKIKGHPDLTFFDIPDHLLPMPPIGTVWHREENVLRLRQHCYYTDSVPDVKIYTFLGKASDNESRFAYLSLFDGVTMQGYTDCVPESFEDHPKAGKLRDYYPPSVERKKFTRDGVPYWRGHTLDFSTTICNEKDDPWLMDVSTRLCETFVPEPYGSWAQTIATQRVKKLRDRFGGYSRLFVYPFAKKTVLSGAAIPEGVLFCEYGRSPSFNHNNTFSIPYSSLHPIHSTTNYTRDLEKTRDKVHAQSDGVGIQPIVLNHVNKKSEKNEMFVRSSFDGYTYASSQDKYNLAGKMGLRLRAESEAKTIEGKVLYLCSLLKSGDEVPIKIYKYLSRSIAHYSNFLDEGYESRISVISDTSLSELQASMVDSGFLEDDSLLDALKRIAANHKDAGRRENSERLITEQIFVCRSWATHINQGLSAEVIDVKAPVASESTEETILGIKCENIPQATNQQLLQLKFKRAEGESSFLNNTINVIKENLSFTSCGLLGIEIKNLYTREVGSLNGLFSGILLEKQKLSIHLGWTPKIKHVTETAVATPSEIKKKLDELTSAFPGRFSAMKLADEVVYTSPIIPYVHPFNPLLSVPAPYQQSFSAIYESAFNIASFNLLLDRLLNYYDKSKVTMIVGYSGKNGNRDFNKMKNSSSRTSPLVQWEIIGKFLLKNNLSISGLLNYGG